MTEPNVDRLRQNLDLLDQQLEVVEGIDDQTKERLDHIVKDIEFLLARSNARHGFALSVWGNPPLLPDRLSRAMVVLESSHPRVVSTLQRVAEAIAALNL